jgi:hypothetical protein
VFRDAKNANTKTEEARVDREAAEILRDLRATAESKTSRNRKIALALLAIIATGGVGALAYKTVLGKTAIMAAVKFGRTLPGLLTGGKLMGLLSSARAKLWSAAWSAGTTVSQTLGRVTNPITRWWSPHLLNNSQYVKYMRESNLLKHRLAVLGGAVTAGTTLGKAAMARVSGQSLGESQSSQSPQSLNNDGSAFNSSAAFSNHAELMRALQNQARAQNQNQNRVNESSSSVAECRYGVSTRTGACRDRPRSRSDRPSKRHSRSDRPSKRHSRSDRHSDRPSRRTTTRRSSRRRT